MNPKQFFYILLVIAAVILAGGSFAYYQATQRLTTSASELGQILAKVEVATTQAATLSRLSVEYDTEIRPLLPRMEDALPKTKQQSHLARQIKTAADAAGVRVTSLTFESSTNPSPTSQTQSEGDLRILPINLNATGSYAAIQHFLQRLEQFPRQAEVQSVSLNRSGSDVIIDSAINFYFKP